MLGQKRNNSVFLKEERRQKGAFINENMTKDELMSNISTNKDLTVAKGNMSEENVVSNISARAVEMLEIEEVGEVEKIRKAEKIKREPTLYFLLQNQMVKIFLQS